MIRKFLLGLLLVFIAIQFFRPQKNISTKQLSDDITLHFNVPDSVRQILEKSCYDCHSDNTVYPWYNYVQPVAWWLASHIHDGKRHLNFSEFNGYAAKKQYHAMKNTVEQIKKNEMPIDSYLWIHKYAVLNDQQKKILSSWADELGKEIKTKNNLPDEPKHPDEPPH